MKVLNSIIDPRMGGPQHRALNVAERLTTDGVSTIFLVPYGSDEFTNRLNGSNFRYQRIKQPRMRAPGRVKDNVRFIVSFNKVVQDVRSVIAEEDIDIVHANMSTNIQVALAAAQSDAKLIWHLNAMVVPNPINYIIGTLARRWANTIVVSSEAVKDYYALGNIETRTIYPPVNLSEFDPGSVDIDQLSMRDEFGIDPDVPVIGTVGNINRIKGYQYLLDVVAILKESFGEVAVVIVGSKIESQEAYFDQLAEQCSQLELADAVTFTGWRSDIPELMSLFDLFVLSSISESGPMVVPEAMAMECPVVMTNVGFVPEHFEDGVHGWIVPPKNSEKLATSIRDALSNPNKGEVYARNAQAKVQESLSLEESAESHLKVYRELISPS